MTMGNSAIVLYCKTKKRQWTCQLYLLIQYVHARPAKVTHCPFQVSKQQKYKKKCMMNQEFVPKKMQLGQMSRRRIVLKSFSAAVCGGTVKKNR